MRTGQIAENLATIFLQRHALILLHHNYRTRFGEIDLVMQENHVIVFVEVRYRRSCRYGFPHETISRQKQMRLHLAAMDYLQRYQLENYPSRFDVLSMHGAIVDPTFEWFKDAIQVE